MNDYRTRGIHRCIVRERLNRLRQWARNRPNGFHRSDVRMALNLTKVQTNNLLQSATLYEVVGVENSMECYNRLYYLTELGAPTHKPLELAETNLPVSTTGKIDQVDPDAGCGEVERRWRALRRELNIPKLPEVLTFAERSEA